MNDNLKKLELPLLLLAIILVVSPLLELAGTAWPIQVRNPEWRFGVFGLLSQALLTPIIGSTLVVLVAELLERRRLKFFMSLVNGLVALLVLVVLPLFALDSLELRGRFQAETPEQLEMVIAAKRSLDVAAGKALVIHSLILLFLALLARFGFMSWRKQLGEDKRSVDEPHPLSLQRLGAAEGAKAQRQSATPAPEPPPLEPIEPEETGPLVEVEDDGELPKLDLD